MTDYVVSARSSVRQAVVCFGSFYIAIITHQINVTHKEEIETIISIQTAHTKLNFEPAKKISNKLNSAALLNE